MRWLSIQIGIPLMLTGIIMYAMGLIINYIIMSVWDVSYPFVRFVSLLGAVFTVVGGTSILNIGKVENEL